MFYQVYAETLKANSVLFVCEGKFEDKEFIKPTIPFARKEGEKILMCT